MNFFFFQAEDGIRDVAVTGVQTCALPICSIPAYFTIADRVTTIGYVDIVVLGSRIQAERTERGLTLQTLADRSGVSVSMLSSVERGAKAPTIVVLDRIADGLGVPLTRLLTE